MASDKNTDITQTLDRILRERLEQFEVPSEVRQELRRDILAFFQRPETKPFGAAVMTPEASMAADQARKDSKTQEPGTHTPKVV
jgi:hypothetical protein